MTSQKMYSYDSQSKKDGQPIACYQIAKRTYNIVMTYVGNCTINMTLVMLVLVGNKPCYSAVITVIKTGESSVTLLTICFEEQDVAPW